MMLGDEADLARGLALAIDDQMEFDQRMGAQRLGQGAACLIIADRSDKDAARAERHQIARDVARAADHQLRALDRNDRRRRFRRNARHLAIYELIQHQIADAEHRLLG